MPTPARPALTRLARPRVRASQFVGNTASVGAYNELWINDGTGNFSAASGAIVSTYENTQAVAWADVDGDGHVDLVSAARPRPALARRAVPSLRHPSC